jgi:hypothetical protein
MNAKHTCPQCQSNNIFYPTKGSPNEDVAQCECGKLFEIELHKEREAHTPTPWGICPVDYRIIEGDEVNIDANARHIVKCVNTHDVLVDALQACYTYMTDNNASDVTGDIALNKINNALKLAKGEQHNA